MGDICPPGRHGSFCENLCICRRKYRHKLELEQVALVKCVNALFSSRIVDHTLTDIAVENCVCKAEIVFVCFAAKTIARCLVYEFFGKAKNPPTTLNTFS